MPPRRRTAFHLPARTLVLVLVVALAPLLPGMAHDVTMPVIVDTDMAIDDARAIALLAADSHVELLAAVATEGSSSARRGAANLHWLLSELGRGPVPVGVGAETPGEDPAWRGLSDTLGWAAEFSPGDLEHIAGELEPAAEMLPRALEQAHGPVTYLCLGPATTLSNLLAKSPSLASRIGTVYFLGDFPGSSPEAWNTARDAAALRSVVEAGIDLRLVWLAEKSYLVYDDALAEALAPLDSPAARVIRTLHGDARVEAKLDEGHLAAWDETLVLAFLEPKLVAFRPGPRDNVRVATSWNPSRARERLLSRLELGASQALPPRQAVILASYPVSPSMMRPDVATIVPTLIERHGLEEWKATWLTNELHRHLGIYSMIGAKMGVRARELLGGPSLDEVEVISEAGLQPPIACFNDGLQVSTGASLGRGTITVNEPPTPSVEALFVHGDRRVRLTLRQAVIDRIRSDIRAAIAEHGNLTPAYFQRVRELALEYWVELDRRTIFDTHDH